MHVIVWNFPDQRLQNYVVHFPPFPCSFIYLFIYLFIPTWVEKFPRSIQEAQGPLITILSH